ncbi:MAG: hypothetical protein WCX93_00460 [Burkholderiaceae bacterium]
MFKKLSYDWFVSNEGLNMSLFSWDLTYLSSVWRVGYSYWTIVFIFGFIFIRYFRIRYVATEQQLECMGKFAVNLIVAFSVVWCAVVTFDNMELVFVAGEVFPTIAGAEIPLFQPENLPASAPAVSLMLGCLLWEYVGHRMKKYLILYVVFGFLLSVISGPAWPLEIVVGAIIGLAGARFGQWYFRFARRYAAS